MEHYIKIIDRWELTGGTGRMIYHTGVRNKAESDTQKRELKIEYFQNPNVLPDEVMEGVYAAIDKVEPHIALGIYAYLFTAITPKNLAVRYIIRDKESTAKEGNPAYVMKKIIAPAFSTIRDHCRHIKSWTTTNPYDVSVAQHNMVQCKYSAE